jgi:hypothetical protein
MPAPKDPAEYARKLEAVLAQCLQPLKNIPFKWHYTSQCSALYQ